MRGHHTAVRAAWASRGLRPAPAAVARRDQLFPVVVVVPVARLALVLSLSFSLLSLVARSVGSVRLARLPRLGRLVGRRDGSVVPSSDGRFTHRREYR